jgi:hypothetical protein
MTNVTSGGHRVPEIGARRREYVVLKALKISRRRTRKQAAESLTEPPSLSRQASPWRAVVLMTISPRKAIHASWTWNQEQKARSIPAKSPTQMSEVAGPERPDRHSMEVHDQIDPVGLNDFSDSALHLVLCDCHYCSR